MGDCIRSGRYRVAARHTRSTLLAGAKGCILFMVACDIGPGPLNIVVDNPARPLSGDALQLPPWPAAPRFNSAMPLPGKSALARLDQLLDTALPRHAPPESLITLFEPPRRLPPRQAARDQRFHEALDLISCGRLEAGIALIRGCGEGLTPSGDDFICGLMLALRLQRHPARARALLPQALGGNLVANAFLKLAARGRVNIALQRLLEHPTPARLKAVCAFGHSSGADLLCGLRQALAHPF